MFDLAVWGEGEQAIVSLAHALSRGKEYSITSIPQIYYKNNIGSVVRSEVNVKKYVDINNLPFDDFSDFFNVYTGTKQQIVLPIEGGRGCHWNKCHFCYLNQGYKYRTKSITHIINKIQNGIAKYKVYNFSFLDNDVIGNNLHSFNLLLDSLIKIKEEYPDFKIMLAEIISRGINKDIIKKMHLAGFIHVQIGYESPSDNLLHKINKKNTFASNLLFIKWAFEYHINIGGMNVLRGLLEENHEDILEAIKNLHYLRFFKNGMSYSHEISSLAINNMSRYYKQLNKEELECHYADPVKEMLPRNYVKEEYNHFFFQYVRRFQDNL